MAKSFQWLLASSPIFPLVYSDNTIENKTSWTYSTFRSHYFGVVQLRVWEAGEGRVQNNGNFEEFIRKMYIHKKNLEIWWFYLLDVFCFPFPLVFCSRKTIYIFFFLIMIFAIFLWIWYIHDKICQRMFIYRLWKELFLV